jgi:hypothetical protein
MGFSQGVGSLQTGVCTSSTKPASPYDGQVIYMNDVDQTAVWDGTQWTVLAPIAGNRNIVVNGDFKIWQRGTSFSNPANGSFTADRWFMYYDGTGATRTISQQTFTGDNPTGLNVSNYMRVAITVAGTSSGTNGMFSKIEDVRKLNNQTVTLSFYGKADASRTVNWQTYQQFGTGGSGSVQANTTNFSFTSSWQRFSVSFTMPSVSGKTITSGNSVSFIVAFPVNAIGTFDITGIQLEAGSVATPFEFEDFSTTLAKCQRYYMRWSGGTNERIGLAVPYTTTNALPTLQFPVTMRASASSVTYLDLKLELPGVGTNAVTSVTLNGQNANSVSAVVTVASGLTAWQPRHLQLNSTSGFLAVSAEL